jgi:hypothetical protein
MPAIFISHSSKSAVYQYYCKNLPRAGEPQYPIWRGLPAESRMTLDELTARIDECTNIGEIRLLHLRACGG